MERVESRNEVRLRVAPAPDAPLRARTEVASLGLPPPACHDVMLLVSELVTNSVVHAGLVPGQEIDLRLAAACATVRVEVRDDGRGFGDALMQGGDRDHFGLLLVERLSDRWGVERGAQTCVWFELDLAPAA